MVISHGTMVVASTLFRVFPKLTSSIASGRLLLLQQQWRCVFKTSTGGEVRYIMHHLCDVACLCLMCRVSGVTGRLSVMTQPFHSKQYLWSTHLVKAESLVTAQPLHGWMTCPWNRKPCNFKAAQPLPGLVTRASPNQCESRSAQAESPGLAATTSRPRKMRVRAGPQLACSYTVGFQDFVPRPALEQKKRLSRSVMLHMSSHLVNR